MELKLFKPFNKIWLPIIKAVQENKPLPINVIRGVTARKTGKTWTCDHCIIAIVLIYLFFGKSVYMYFVRNSREMVINSMTEFCNYMQEMCPEFLTWKNFNKSSKTINFKTFNASGHILNPVTNPNPTLGLANTRSDLIIIFADERSQIDGRLYSHFNFTVRSDQPNHQKLIVEIANPDGRDTEWSKNIFNVLELPLEVDKLLEEEPDGYRLKIVGKTAYFHCQCTINPFLTFEEKMEFERAKIENPYLANMTVYGIPSAINGCVYDNLPIMLKIPNWEQQQWQSLKIGVDIGYTDTEGNGGSTCVQVGLYSQINGILMVDGYRHNNNNNPLPAQSVYKQVYNFIKEAYKKYEGKVMLKNVRIYVDETGAATWLETHRIADQDPISENFIFRSTKDINKNGWPNQNRAVDVNSWMTLGVFSCLEGNNWLMDDLKNCVWVKGKTLSEASNDKIVRWHKYTDNLNAMEYAIWDEKDNLHNLAKLKATYLLEARNDN